MGYSDRASALPLAFFLPAVAHVLCVNLYPALSGIATSLFETRYAAKVAFVGLANYSGLLHSARALQALRTSVVFVAGSVCGSLLVGLGLALLLARQWPLRNVFRTILLAPWVISQTVTALLWGWLLNPQYGPVTYALGELGISGVDPLGTPQTALATIIGINVWHMFPLAMVLLLAALQTIGSELAEASRIDGASTWQHFRYVTLPLLRRTVMMVAITLTIYSFSQVTLIYTLTGGGPLGTTEALAVLAFKVAFTDWRLGYAAAIGGVIFVLNLLFAAAYIRVLRSAD
jgi:multiple sugar transport system permease protein